jgi:hypothetical protein
VAVNISEYPNVLERATELGLNKPSDITFLPRGFLDAQSKKDLLNEATVSTLRKLFRKKELIESRLDNDTEKIPYIHENANDWIAPVVFYSFSTLSQNLDVIAISCEVISDYVTNYFKGIKKNPTVKLEIVLETTKSKKTKKVSYEGEVEGLRDLPATVKEVFRG